MIRATMLGLFCAGSLGLGGCGQPESRDLVTGLVTLDDQPLPDAKIQFVVTGGGPGAGQALFGARTDAEGRYRVPAIPGCYNIVVLKWVRKDGYPVDPKRDDPGQMEFQGRAAPDNPLRLAVPIEYTRANQTPFTKDVVAGAQTIDLELKSKQKSK